MSDGKNFYDKCGSYQRINVACSKAVLLEALDRLYNWYQTL